MDRKTAFDEKMSLGGWNRFVSLIFCGIDVFDMTFQYLSANINVRSLIWI